MSSWSVMLAWHCMKFVLFLQAEAFMVTVLQMKILS
jgi:hypothetical protein